MSSMKKRIPMFLLALAMMVAMALPTFADSPSVYSSLGDSVSSVQNTYYQLNAATEGDTCCRYSSYYVAQYW